MKYTTYHDENYYPVQSGSSILVFYRNLCFSWADGFAPELLYSDFGPPEVTELPVLPPGFFATLSAVAAENQGDPIGAMLTVCATRSFPADDAAAAAHWAQSVNMMIRSLTHGGAAYSESGFTLTNTDGENAPVNLTNILESHCLPSEQTYQEEDTAMGTSENNADVLSMEELLKIAEEAAPAENNADVLSAEELLKIAEEAAPADAPMDDPVLAEAAAEMPSEPVEMLDTAMDAPVEPAEMPEAPAEIPAEPVETVEEPVADSAPEPVETISEANPDTVAEGDMAMSDDAVDAIVANMLGDIPAAEEIPPIDETAPLPEDIIPDIPLAEEDPMAAVTAAMEEPMIEEPAAEQPVAEEPAIEETATEEPAPAMEETAPAEEEAALSEDTIIMEETTAAEEAMTAEEIPADAEALMAEEAVIPEEPLAMEEPIAEEGVEEASPADGEALIAEEAPVAGTPLLTPMNDDTAHCVLCVRVDPAEVGLDIPEGSSMMISDNTVIFPEGGALLTQDLLTGAKDRSELNESVLAAFSISMERFATQNEAYTLHSILFSWLLKKLLIVSEDPSAAQKINDTLAFLGSPFRYAETGFTDGTGQTPTVAEVFLQLSAQKI